MNNPKIWVQLGAMGDLQRPMVRARGIIAQLYFAKKSNFYILSIRDGRHKPGSLHPEGLAEDYWDRAKIVSKKEIQDALGPDYDVVEYDWGYHVEYDPKY